jgi:hypothetical protein
LTHPTALCFFSLGISPHLVEDRAISCRSGEKQTTILKFEYRKSETNTKSWTQIFPDAHRFKNQYSPSPSARKKQANFFPQTMLHCTFRRQADLK